MNHYEYLRHLDPDNLRVLWISAVQKGDQFIFSDEEVKIVHNTTKTLRLKYKDQTYTFKKYGHLIVSEGKCDVFLKDIEGQLTIDLINQYNPFHTISDVFKLTLKSYRTVL